MGPSGSGKTTLAKVLARLYDPSGGAVRFDGLDIREFPLADLRKYIGFVSQEPVVFRGTIADNIRYGSGQASMHNVVAAAQHAQIHEFIERLPSRYETITHERGLTLSGGQKQRVNLARALLYDPKVLVLDDCTSALDADTEAKLVRGFEQALRDRTVVLVSHRVSIALGCDLVLMLDKGKVVQFGPPDELAQMDGPFGDLYREQLSRARSAGPALVN
jgi:ATP-binding cassette subfamily B protein